MKKMNEKYYAISNEIKNKREREREGENGRDYESKVERRERKTMNSN
jgi:hypothetical protein